MARSPKERLRADALASRPATVGYAQREPVSAWFEEAWSQTPNGRGALTEPGARLRYDDATARNRSRANA